MSTAWPALPVSPELGADSVEVVAAELGEAVAWAPRFERLLEPGERQRAYGLASAEGRARFILTRALLRCALGRYLQRDPASLRLAPGPFGKPALAEPGVDLDFNVSHSMGLALYAFTRGQPVGVDVERIRPGLSFLRIAQRAFSPGEYAALLEADEALRPAAFFSCWVRKEAYTKGLGKGLHISWRGVEVTDQAARLTAEEAPAHELEEPRRWSLREVPLVPPYVAAVAVRSPAPRLRCWRLEPSAAAAAGVAPSSYAHEPLSMKPLNDRNF